MTSNIARMRSQVGGYRATASTTFEHMDRLGSTLTDALDRIKGIDFTEELTKLNDLQARKESISALIASVNQSNASVLSLLP
jgi:flagellin-like hook-associated protein FlgL